MIKRITPILALTAACWLVFALNNLVWQGHLDQHGIIPRHLAGLTGIIWAPFLHASFQHLAANTVPLLVLGAIICARGKGEFVVVTVGGILLGGGLTWLFARNACHIGASGLIFCYFGYVASLAWFNRTFGTLCLSVLCILGYGGMIRGILPTLAGVSWEGHLAGLVTGVALGAFMSKLKKEPAVNPVFDQAGLFKGASRAPGGRAGQPPTGPFPRSPQR
jgi:membrane associated rhomboid family serine protease